MAQGRPPDALGHDHRAREWTPGSFGTRSKERREFLRRRVKEVRDNARLAEWGIVRLAQWLEDHSSRSRVYCPECTVGFLARQNGVKTPRGNARVKIMDHAAREHPELSDRERSLLADRAVEAAGLG